MSPEGILGIPRGLKNKARPTCRCFSCSIHRTEPGEHFCAALLRTQATKSNRRQKGRVHPSFQNGAASKEERGSSLYKGLLRKGGTARREDGIDCSRWNSKKVEFSGDTAPNSGKMIPGRAYEEN